MLIWLRWEVHWKDLTPAKKAFIDVHSPVLSAQLSASNYQQIQETPPSIIVIITIHRNKCLWVPNVQPCSTFAAITPITNVTFVWSFLMNDPEKSPRIWWSKHLSPCCSHWENSTMVVLLLIHGPLPWPGLSRVSSRLFEPCEPRWWIQLCSEPVGVLLIIIIHQLFIIIVVNGSRQFLFIHTKIYQNHQWMMKTVLLLVLVRI